MRKKRQNNLPDPLAASSPILRLSNYPTVPHAEFTAKFGQAWEGKPRFISGKKKWENIWEKKNSVHITKAIFISYMHTIFLSFILDWIEYSPFFVHKLDMWRNSQIRILLLRWISITFCTTNPIQWTPLCTFCNVWARFVAKKRTDRNLGYWEICGFVRNRGVIIIFAAPFEAKRGYRQQRDRKMKLNARVRSALVTIGWEHESNRL